MSELADVEYFKELCSQSVLPSEYADVRKEFGEMIQKVVLTAKREALTDLCAHFDRLGEGADNADRWAWEWSAEDEIRDYMENRYPEPGARIKARKVE